MRVIGLIQFRIGIIGEPLWMRYWTSEFCKPWIIIIIITIIIIIILLFNIIIIIIIFIIIIIIIIIILMFNMTTAG